MNDEPRDPDDGDDYEVGYAKPPISGQFKPGQSGNPKGRPGGTKNASTLFNEYFETKKQAKIGGKTVKLTGMEIVFRQISQQAMQGNFRFIQLALALWAQHGKTSEDITAADLELDLEMLKSFVAKHGPEGWEDDHAA